MMVKDLKDILETFKPDDELYVRDREGVWVDMLELTKLDSDDSHVIYLGVQGDSL